MINIRTSALYSRLRHKLFCSIWLITTCMYTGLLPAQTAAPNGQLHYFARGTGRTTGGVLAVAVSNPTPAPLRTTIGDCFVPSASDYQGYVIPQTYPIEVPAFRTVTVQLEGYCTNVRRPAIPGGELAASVSRWVTWAAAAPLPAPGQAPGTGFLPLGVAPADDLLGLTYPGTQEPFPYRIDVDQYPESVARLLLHAAWSAGQAFDQLVDAGKIQPERLGRNAATLRQEMVQQTVWAVSARLEGGTYDKNTFALQFIEETEQALNLYRTAFSPEWQQQTDRQVQDAWATISLVGASAKLLAPNAGHRDDLFEETPGGPAVDPLTAVQAVLSNIDTRQSGAADRLLPVLLFLANNKSSDQYFPLWNTASSLWGDFIGHATASVNAESGTALAEIFQLLGYVRIESASNLSDDGRYSFEGALLTALNEHIQYRVSTLNATDPAFLREWRTLKSWQTARWYTDYCSQDNSLKKLPPAIARNGQMATAPAAPVDLANPHWKTVFPAAEGTAPKKFPWWVPAAGIPLAGGLIYLLTRDDGGGTPVLPLVLPDALSLPCKGTGTVDVLANDSGEGIRVTAATGASGVTVALVGPASLAISSQGLTGAFTVGYTITDNFGQTAAGVVNVSVSDQAPPVVSCPPSMTLEGCGQAPAPTLSGQASATDDCDPAPSITYTDELVGTPCARTVTRTWAGADAAGKTATCVQTIAVQDQTPPAITLCPATISVAFGQQNDLGLTGAAQAGDACTANVPLSFTDDLGGVSECTGPLIRTWTAADGCSNTASCTQTIQVSDQTAPVMALCPPAITVDCGQQNDLSVTGQAIATDDCTTGITPLFVDDLSGFSGCEGTIIRYWTATDQAGNTAGCDQLITVAPVPCTFTPTFAVGPTVCGNCDGSVSVAIFPVGPYALVWSNGLSGAFIANLCPADYAVSITDLQKNCTQVFTASVPEIPLNLVVLEAIPPSSPSASDGRVRLQVNPPTGALPLEVFVNGIPVGFAGANVFNLINFAPGIYEIQVVNAAGCASNVVVVELFPQEYAPLPPLLEISRLADPGMSPVFFEKFFEKHVSSPEHPSGTPASQPVWDQPAGIALGLSLSGGWQLRWEESRRQGWQHAAAGRRFLEWSSRSAGLRHFSVRSSRMAVFRDIAVSNTRVRNKAIPAGGPGEPLHLSAWTLTFGGGWRHNLCPGVAVEWSAGLSLSRLSGDGRIHPGLGFRLSAPLQKMGAQR
jgi:hypothetical protein